MNYRIKRRHVLIALIAAAQAICLVTGVFVFSIWLKSSLRETVEQQVLADNILLAGQMSKLIHQMDVADLRENRESWRQLQEAVLAIKLPNDGFVCVIDAKDGTLLCHPDLGSPTVPPEDMVKPGMAAKATMVKPSMSKPPMTKGGMVKPTMVKQGLAHTNMPKSMPQKSMAAKPMMKPKAEPMTKAQMMAKAQMAKAKAMNKPQMLSKPDITSKAKMMAKTQSTERPLNESVTGSIRDYAGEVQVIAAAYMSQVDAYVNVHQKASGIEQSVAKTLRPVVPLGAAVSLGLVACTTALIIGIMRRYDNRLAAMNEELEELVDQRTRSLRKTRDAIIFGLAKLAESRDTDTGEHLDRIRFYVSILARHLSKSEPRMNQQFIDNLALASSLHDIGKVGIPDNILLKPGRFTPEERSVMEEHAVLGGRCLKAIGEQLGEDDFLQLSRDIAYCHHEKWDGTGYPFRISGESIPLAARIVALADVYDALRSRRPYKEPMPHAKAKSIILDGRGTHFDPTIVDAFLECESFFVEVSERYNAAPPTAAQRQPEAIAT